MAREIKFRAWDISSRTMFYNHSVTISISGSIHFLETNCEWIEPDKGRIILMQYTGLKDKNGKEIFEGDVVKENSGDMVGEIIFFEGAFVSKNKFRRLIPALFMGDATQGMNINFLEVIGNIFQNPELLTP